MFYIRYMRMRTRTRLARPLLLTAALVASISWAQAENRPMDNYRSIIDRNPFGLKPVPPPPPAPTNNPTPIEKPAEFYLTGISTVGYPKRPKRAYLMNKDNSKKDKDKYYTLSLNEPAVNDMRLDEVDEKARRVKITYQDKEMWLSMKDNGVPAPAGGGMPMPGMPAIPGMQPGMNPGIAPQPSAIPLPNGAVPTANPAMSQPSYPSQNLNRRIPRSGSTGTFTPGGTAAAATAATAAIPGPTINFGNSSVPAQPSAIPPNAPPAAPPLDPAEQYLRMKLEETANRGATPPVPTL
jgi:hypothetical protein